MTDDEQAQAGKGSPRPVSAFALALEQLCSALDETVNAALGRLHSRLEASERAVRDAKSRQSQQLRALADKSRRESEELDAQLHQQREQRQREAAERREERQWLAELWPDGVPLPTLLQPFAPGASDGDNVNASVKSVKDADERRRLEALVARRAMKERVLRRLEAAKQWTVVLPPATEQDGDSKPYYVNAETGESTWDAPTALFFEPPEGWDAARMDWRASYPLENFYPKLSGEQEPEDDEDDEDAAAIDGRNAVDDADDDVDDDDGTEELDPVECRREMEKALAAHEQLTSQLEQSKTQQRALALQLLNATREAFEREKEALKQEDKAVKDEERKRRRAAQQEQAAARAKEAAAERKRLEAQNPGQQFPKFARDSVAKKDLTLAKDDDALEKELEAFAAEQRAERPYLTAPLAVDKCAREHHQLDVEFVHMKHLEQEAQQTEQLEFDLLEKTALRHEEAAAKSDELRALAKQIRVQQVEVTEEIPRLESTIQRLEAPLATLSDRRPTEGELKSAKERYITPEPLGTGADDSGCDEDEQQEAEGEGHAPTGPPPTTLEPDAQLIAQDEDELRELKRLVDVERQWRLWEKEESMRQQELLDAQERLNVLVTTQRSLAVDLALCEADEAFFTRLRDLEKAGNTRMWAVQADSQVERVRFMIERAAREESVYQVNDRLQELRVQLEEAQRLPLQALNAVERLELQQKSIELVRGLESKAALLSDRLAKEEAAKTLLLELERRSTRYFQEKLKEESALFMEKQALWDLNVQLVDEVQTERQVIARLYQLMEGEKQQPTDGDGASESLPSAAPSSTALVDEASRAFEVKLQYQQQVRQFLLSCYEREARWRDLAAIAFVKDCTSEQWMTSAQRERHEQMLALLQEQHDERVAALQRELKLRAKIEAQLHQHIEQLTDRMERMRREYQASDDAVRDQMQLVISELQRKIGQFNKRLQDEQLHYRADRERLISSHDQARRELEQRLQHLEQVNDSQRHWLTAAKRELMAQRVSNEELLKTVQALEQRRATEVNDLRFRVAAQIAKINTIEMWNLALKLKAKEANAERVKMMREFAVKTEQHRQLQRLLRLQIWRHRVTAQAILGDVNLLFAFFADGLEILAGATRASNDALRDNAGIQVLAALATHSSQQRVRAISAQALGRVAWNSNATARSLGWKAKHKWLSWVKTQSDGVLATLSAEQLEFDAVPSEASTCADWLDDTASHEASEDDMGWEATTAEMKLQFIRSWLHVEDRELPSENAANQEHIGLTPGVLQTIVDLCRGQSRTENPSGDDNQEPADDWRAVQHNALESLALVAMNTRNTALVGLMDGVIPLLAQLIRPLAGEEGKGAVTSGSHLSDWEVVRCAVRALGNLAFENRFNQQHMCAVDDGGVIPLLLSYCDPYSADRSTIDVDLVLASVQALTNLVGDFTPACECVFDAGGVLTLTRLCNSQLIHDAVELGVSESIQAHAALVISSVVTLLDSDDCESDGRAASVADAIMKEEEEARRARASGDQRATGGVVAFVLMCASCNRDVAFHGALVLGNIARHDEIRAAIGAAIGAASGVDALFLLASAVPDNQAKERNDDGHRVDVEMLAQATWALANLTWNRDNQYRVARYLHVLYRLCTISGRTSNQEPAAATAADEGDDLQLCASVHEHALCVLANSLFYNDANRQLVAGDPKWLVLLERVCLQGSGTALEHAARALCALSYNDEIALAMGASKLAAVSSSEDYNGNNNNNNNNAVEDPTRLALPFNGLALFVRLCGREEQHEVQRLALFGVVNLVLHDANKPRLLRVPHGVETLVNLSAHASAAVREPALEALDLLADVRQIPRQLLDPSAAASTVGGQSTESLKRLVALLGDPSSSAAVVAMASDAIPDEAWRRPSAKARLRNERALEVLLRRCSPEDKELPATSPAALASCLWALRNVVSDNARNQDVAGALDGVATLAKLLDAPLNAQEDVVKATLTALAALVMRHARNSQELVRFGLDVLLALADRVDGSLDASADAREESTGRTHKRAVDSLAQRERSKSGQHAADARVETAALARELLQLVAPHNALPPLAKSPAKSPAKAAMRQRQQQQLPTTLPALDGR